MSDFVNRLREGLETCGVDRCRVRDVASGCICATAAAEIERLRAALRWALPLATMALEDCRQQRVKWGHTDIIGTYRNGQTWVGIHQSEVDALEEARAALAAPSAALEERT